MSWTVPLADVRVEESDVEAVLDVMRSGWMTMGPRTSAFEDALAGWIGTPHAVAVSSGTAGLHLACRAAGVGPGDEVIVPANTFVSSASTPRLCGAEAVLCDVEAPERPNLDLADVERRITARTKAVIAVHFAGYPADVVAVRKLCDERGIVLIEDSAQAIGAAIDADGRRAGTIGHLGCFSFFSKNQLCVGEGGAVTSADEELAKHVRLLRSHAMTSGTWDRHRGHEASYDVVEIGFNYRMDEARAALGASRLPRLHDEIAGRRAVARGYRERLADLPGLELTWDAAAVERSSHFAFLVLLRDRAARDAFRDALRERGVQTTWYPALHAFTEYAPASAWGSLPNAEAASERHCALPMASSLTDLDLDLVAEAARAALA
ncbi:MAG: DegT/DnrJ/EryC1/StrS family aminotransferase [Solirubrobacterales bacterium]|nr:DegT/DnrJ/EryC1/StrS family aminotransferase [Solirubrobacterales bacterium]